MSDLSCLGVGYMYVRKWSQSSVVDTLEQKFGDRKEKVGQCTTCILGLGHVRRVGPIPIRIGAKSDVSCARCLTFLDPHPCTQEGQHLFSAYLYVFLLLCDP